MRPVSSQEKIITSQKKDRNNPLTTQNKLRGKGNHIRLSLFAGKYSATLHRKANRLISIPMYRSLRLSAGQPAHLPVKRPAGSALGVRCRIFTIWWF